MNKTNDKNTLLNRIFNTLDNFKVNSWKDISITLESLKKQNQRNRPENSNYLQEVEDGIAFITFDYGIDGVSIEIQKYAQCLEILFKEKNSTKIPLHFIGGYFHKEADTVLKPEWHRFRIPNSNGWSKWHNGKWFSKLFYEDMPENSAVSKEMSKEIWKQAVIFSKQLAEYIIKNNIKLLIPVNICTNPGNPAIALAVVLVSELLSLKVISSNHDFYWEGGKADRPVNKEKGPRDHFFKNYNNREFFELFVKLFPWNGDNWIQVNINKPQTENLVNNFGFSKKKVYEIGSCISNEFLKIFGKEEVRTARKKMNYILSDGKNKITTIPVNTHLSTLSSWMSSQKPLVCSFKESSIVDLTAEKTLYCLQPTRVVGRKRIYKDLELLSALLNTNKLKSEFENNRDYQIILHITGPVPIEHQSDLETVLNAYIKLCNNVPETISHRIFLAFSVGTEDHPALKAVGLKKLCIEEIYRLANIILFPSETEGRGLPIIESGASGIPIVCSRYYPEEVFDGVIGKNLPEEKQIKYIPFPENDNFSDKILVEISVILLTPKYREKYAVHNRNAVSKRYGNAMLVEKFNLLIQQLY